jgi:acyl carrier protein
MNSLTLDEVKKQILEWILQKSSKISADQLTEVTPLIESRILSSLQVMELLLFLEKVKGSRLAIKNLKPGTFKDVQTICQTFFGELK